MICLKSYILNNTFVFVMYKKKTFDLFVIEARAVHDDKYDYSKVEYVNNLTKVCIICPEHGEFWKSPKHHLHGQGCPKCAKKIASVKRTSTVKQFIEKARNVHGDKYNYSKVEYKNNLTKVCIICLKHGEFWMTPHNHLARQGCPKCSGRYHTDTAYFIEKAREIHGDKYDYFKVNYKDSKTKVCITCPKHGEFWQTPQEHLQNKGCQKCSHSTSKEEIKLCGFLEENNMVVEQRVKNIISPYELDLYIPEKNIAIEYNGLIWHSEKFRKENNYHLKKTELCEKQGIRLIHVFEDEWLEHENIVKSRLKQILGCDTDLPKVLVKTCVIDEIDNQSAKEFLIKNHIQGFVSSSVYLGCFYNNELISVMTFKHDEKDSDKWKLTRFATDINKRCVGVGEKMFKCFVKNYCPSEINIFADRRWYSVLADDIYAKLGFKVDKILNSTYYYIVEKHRLPKFGFRKNVLLKKYPNSGLTENMTEHEMCQKLGFQRIYDCGLIKYKWLKK